MLTRLSGAGSGESSPALSVSLTTMQPVEALRRIAYLLERDGAESYKVWAFRRAAAAIAELGPERLRQLAATCGLRQLSGVGETTARAITEALEGGAPSYLSALEAREPSKLEGRAGELRGLLAGDCHSHSDWSDGGSPTDEMAEAAREPGHRYLALTDHSPRLTVAHGLDRERLLRQLDVVQELNSEMAPFRILTGIEVDILEDGSLDQDEDLLARLDVVVASVHSKLKMESAAMTRRMIAAVESPSSMLTPSSKRVREPGRRLRSTRGPSVGTHLRRFCERRWTQAACSAWIPIPTLPASSSGSATVASKPRMQTFRTTGWSTLGPSRSC
jgi:putative hydrolase